MKVDLNRRFKGHDGQELADDNIAMAVTEDLFNYGKDKPMELNEKFKSRNSDGTYVYNESVDRGDEASQNLDLDKIRLIVRDGIIVGYTGE